MQKESSNEKLDKFADFEKWFIDNGGLIGSIQFPSCFPPTDYLGVSAKSGIKPNTVILAVPKSVIISLQRVQASQLGPIIKDCAIFSDQENDDRDYNILCLFLIMEKMKGSKSFFWSYLQLLGTSETMVDWSNAQILSICDPYINLKFITSVKKQFNPTFEVFREISQRHTDVFPRPISRELFDEFYAIVMTRGFGWGLPETMLVPFADFFNHSSSGVNHYVYSSKLENQKQGEGQGSNYIKKKFELDLSLLKFDNKSMLPVDYGLNSREELIKSRRNFLEGKAQLKADFGRKMDSHQTKVCMNLIREEIVGDNFTEPIYMSSDSEDNDSQDEEETSSSEGSKQKDMGGGQILSGKEKQVRYLKYMFSQIEKELEQRFSEPKPLVNSEFEEGVEFDWWFEGGHSQKQKFKSQGCPSSSSTVKWDQTNQSVGSQHSEKYFIVSSSCRIRAGDQIFNCYGRRSNRFLLIWYGFCFENNKYDSVPFRIWSQKVQNKIGKCLHTKYVTEVEYAEMIPIGNDRFSVEELSTEFRLKKNSLNYKLLGYLRFRHLKNDLEMREAYKRVAKHTGKVMDLEMEISVFGVYAKYLHELLGVFVNDKEEKSALEQIWGGSTGSARQYYKKVLQKSNESILTNQLLAVQQIMKVLNSIQIELRSQKSVDLISIYKKTFESYTKLKNSDRAMLKIMVRQYFLLLAQSEALNAK